MRYLIIFMLAATFYSCIGSRGTKFTDKSISIGMDKESVIKKFGNPFKTNVYTSNNKKIEILYYKEVVDVISYLSGHTFVLTSILYFEDSILTSIRQEEEHLPNVSIKKHTP